MLSSVRVCALVAALVLGLLAPAFAQPVTFSWEPNPEPDVAGYVLRLGLDPARLDWEIDVGPRTSWTLPELPAPATVYFRVVAYAKDGLRGLPSALVSVSPQASAADGPSSALPETWRQWHRLGADAADEDGDGVTNLAEHAAGTSPSTPNEWLLGEGATGVFKMRLALANPWVDAAHVRVSFLGEGGPRGEQWVHVPGLGRTTLAVNDVPGLGNEAISSVVTSTRGGVVVERTMSWGGRRGEPVGRAGHTGRPPTSSSRAWYFAEGAAGFFDTYFLMANPGAAAAKIDVEFHDEVGQVVGRSYDVGPRSRLTVATREIAELAGRSFATRVTSSVPVVAERAMYFGKRKGLWQGGHVSAGIVAPATTWYLAEGCTGPVFDTYLLLANPNDVPATATVGFLTPAGQAFEREVRLAPRSRLTILVDREPGLADTAVSMVVTATEPIVVERSMYWLDPKGGWREGHNSAGETRLGTRWVLAEGESAGPNAFESYVLVVNPGPSWADVTVTFLQEDGTPVAVARQVAPRSRLTVSAAEARVSGSRFGVLVLSTEPVAVERSMYWSSEGVAWSGGTHATGVKVW